MLVPKYLFSKKYLFASIPIIMGFSIIFMLLYKPFSATVWFGLSNFRQMSETVSFYAAGVALMALSKFLMMKFQSRFDPSLWAYLCWILAEVVLIALLYILFSGQVVDGGPEFSAALLARTSLCVGLILLIPYSYMILYAGYSSLKQDVDALNQLVQSHTQMSASRMLNLYDSKDELKLSILSTSIYYMEAQDNYVQIFYDLNGSTQSYLLRCPTQKVEKMIEGSSLVRCHRSYIVNLDHVREFVKGHNSSTIVIDDPGAKAIPVSRSYYKSLPSSITGRPQSQ